ncbi:MAG: stage V sporulation protein AD [Evtepia sp.]|uniref:stage V sporulation protein AD n=1 Tax=Evtepia sp. TaxID=2773933 RepID=UPI002A74F8BC|nr:stage V sporulation protein AD [Evtepia sp.]MDY3013809.1 stage V sporulation protein AD [Evtepia sp.]
MDTKKLGRQTVRFAHPPSIVGYGSAAGHMEGQGPLGHCFDFISEDDRFEEKSWEKTETAMQKQALSFALSKAGIKASLLDYVFAGDLLNQCIATSYSLRGENVPLFGLYGACSTMAEGLSLSAMLIDGGFASYTAALTSSHFCSAERQYRSPLEYGGQKPPTAQWTATGSGAVILSRRGPGPFLTHVTTGKVMDKGITDANNMGAAMAPAAYDTIRTHFEETNRSPDFYDLIVTGDLGSLGAEIVADFFRSDGVDLHKNYRDCGVLLFNPSRQDVHTGGSGCGCSALVLTGYLLREMSQGRINHLLFCGTGALHSPISTMQGESIPGICHAVSISTEKEENL